MNGIVVARGGEAEVVTLSDRLRPPGIGFGVGWIHVYPRVGLRRPARALGARRRARRRGARPARRDRLPAADRLIPTARSPSSRSRRGSRAARWPTSCATRSASTSSRSPCGRRSARRCPTRSRCPRFPQPLAIRFFTAEPGPLPTGRVDPDRQPRARARGRGRRPGGHVPAGRRDDPPGPPRRRPARLRDRDGRHQRGGARPGRGSGAAARRSRSQP